jgi:hypothetical protein
VKDYERLLAAYEVDVRFPDVSGMEHLDMLVTRSELARGAQRLDAQQRARLDTADQVLLGQARQFYEAIQTIADLEAWRHEQDAPPTHWWWYLDVLAQLPEPFAPEAPPERVPA